jgi:hypothetical protein
MAFSRKVVPSRDVPPEVTQALLRALRARRPVRYDGACYWVRQKQSSYDLPSGPLRHVFTLQGAPDKDCS